MPDVAPLVSRSEGAADRRMKAFIMVTRQAPNPFSADIDFNADSWDVTAAVQGVGLGRKRITFSNLESAKTKQPFLMRADVREFAKAYLVRLQQINPSKGIQQRLAALRSLDAALQSHDLTIVRLRADVLDHAARLIANHYDEVGAYRIGAQLEAICEFLAEERLVAAPFSWRNPIKRPRDQVRVGSEHEAKRAKRLPTNSALEAVTLAFRRASYPSDRLVAATAALLCCAPVRIGEVLRLREDCEVHDRTADGASAYGLRWWTEKGVDPEVRWIPSSMASTAQAAIAVIKEVTAEARKISGWYERHPDQLYLPPRFEYLRTQKDIALDEADQLLGGDARSWGQRRGVRVQDFGQVGFSFAEFEAEIIRDLPESFPIVETGTGLAASDALFLVQFNEFRTDRGTSLCMIEPVAQSHISNALGGRVEHGVPSMFSRLGITNADGSPIKIKTHAFRHWLNTLAQRGGVDPLDIAKWSGRKSVSQNAAYDHVSADELLADLGEATGATAGAIPVRLQPLATKDDFAQTANGAAHVTEFGFCLHDFAMLPCQLHSDCLNCEEHVCVKGDAARERRLIKFLANAKRLLLLAQAGREEGYEGADRWTAHQERTVRRGERIVALLSDPNIPEGALVGGDGVTVPNGGGLDANSSRKTLPPQ